MWTLLKSKDDWSRYCVDTANMLSVSADSVGFAGTGPKEFPVLVCSTLKGVNTVVSAYVYAADATMLLAAGKPEPPKEAGTQSDFNKWVAAHMLATAYFLVETGICKPSQFEAKLGEALSIVDQTTAERRDMVVASFGKVGGDILDRLG